MRAAIGLTGSSRCAVNQGIRMTSYLNFPDDADILRTWLVSAG